MTCEEYLHDPEGNPSHLDSCPNCRLLALDLAAAVEIRERPLNLEALPLAAWEGASYRTWPLVAAGVGIGNIVGDHVLPGRRIVASHGAAQAVASGVTSFEALAKFVRLFGRGLHGAPPAVHITVGVLFVVINTILFLLLRRAPRGIAAAERNEGQNFYV